MLPKPGDFGAFSAREGGLARLGGEVPGELAGSRLYPGHGWGGEASALPAYTLENLWKV